MPDERPAPLDYAQPQPHRPFRRALWLWIVLSCGHGIAAALVAITMSVVVYHPALERLMVSLIVPLRAMQDADLLRGDLVWMIALLLNSAIYGFGATLAVLLVGWLIRR